jgi:hypothetical protein
LRRAIAPGAAALIVVYASVYSGSDWFGELKRWLHPAAHGAPAHGELRPGPVGMPIMVTPPRPQGTDSSVSNVPLPLILVRTQPGRNSREGFAQIGVNALTPQTYSAGAILANGARLSEIYVHYVVLERDGRFVRLYVRGETREVQPGDPAAAGLLTVGGTTPPAPQLTKAQERLSDYLRPSPVFADGRLRGFALYPGRQRSGAFSRAGLELGDVLTKVDGVAVTDVARSLASLRLLLEGAALTVEIERQGVAQTLSLDGGVLTRTALDERIPGIEAKLYHSSPLSTPADLSSADLKEQP